MRFGSLSLAGLWAFASGQSAPQEKFYTTKLDHFASGGHSPEFDIRYLVNADYYDPETGPILFYSGNEGDIYSFYYNSGFMTETVA